MDTAGFPSCVHFRRVVDALGGYFSSLGRLPHQPPSGALLTTLPEELLLLVATALPPSDLFSFARSCLFVASLLRGSIERGADDAFVRHLETETKMMPLSDCGAFVDEFQQAQLLLELFSNYPAHKFRIGDRAYNACLTTLKTRFVSGGRQRYVFSCDEGFPEIDDELDVPSPHGVLLARSLRAHSYHVALRVLATPGQQFQLQIAAIAVPQALEPVFNRWSTDEHGRSFLTSRFELHDPSVPVRRTYVPREFRVQVR